MNVLVKDEQSALIDLKEFEGDTAKHSMMDSYSVARVLNRGHRRTVMSMISSAIPNLVQGISQQSPALDYHRKQNYKRMHFHH